ncbi:MAG: bifunctional riboflavin kinase/FAD synthetase [Planctomycetaceae bacterium]|jgi:riboflavin kinase/FMN adenylyltransferase|nr:bifunctional riboflavin kinase/FAD synthetase [Planctomycetaceae bacterium]
MQIFHDFESVPATFHNGAISIGKFDGVHCGHALIINHLKNYADKLSVPSVVVTFCPHPITILRPELDVRPIHTLERKIELIGKFNVDAIILIHTDKKFLQQSAETFFFGTLCERLRACVIVCGKNFTFGRDRTGNAESMKNYVNSTVAEIDIVEPVQIDGAIASSSLIRKLIQEGRIKEANTFLGLPYRLSGIVVQGDARGRTLGFPTANLERVETLIPKHGVYAAIATIEGRQFASTTSIGTSPTFCQTTPRIEVFIHNFNKDIYGQELHIDIIDVIREIKHFNSKDELINQMKQDIIQSNKITNH